MDTHLEVVTLIKVFDCCVIYKEHVVTRGRYFQEQVMLCVAWAALVQIRLAALDQICRSTAPAGSVSCRRLSLLLTHLKS